MLLQVRRCHAGEMLSRSSLIAALLVCSVSCGTESPADGVGGTDGEECASDGPEPAVGVWDPTPEDWSDVGPPGYDGDILQTMCGFGPVQAHHCLLDASVSDRDGDLDEVRWFVDGVLIDENQTSLVFTGPHTLEVVARDQRGAATTDRRQIQCD